MRLVSEFVFDAAHRILGHAGKCGYLRAHSYRLEVTVTATGLDELGMVMDFDDLIRETPTCSSELTPDAA